MNFFTQDYKVYEFPKMDNIHRCKLDERYSKIYIQKKHSNFILVFDLNTNQVVSQINSTENIKDFILAEDKLIYCQKKKIIILE